MTENSPQSAKLKLTCLTCGTINAFPAARLADGPKCSSCGDALADGKVAEIGLAELEKAARNDSLPLLADLWAPWCGPCRMMAPEFAKAAQELQGEVRFAKINTEDFPAVSQKHGIRGIPLMIVFQNGREIARHSGAMDTPGIVAWTEAYLTRS